jgi:LAGLIDADG DNA endonuclease family/Zeta toxin
LPDENGTGEKAAVDAVTINRSVLDNPETKGSASGYPTMSSAGNILWWVGSFADEMEPWGRNRKLRDKQLREFIIKESYFAAALGVVAARNAGYSYRLEGPETTVDHYQEVLELSDQGRGWQTLISKLSVEVNCLAGTSRVALAGERLGKTKTIRELVTDRDPGPVLTVNHVGQIVEREVTQWHKSPLAHRYWVWLQTEVSGHAQKRAGGLYLTNDHPVLTPDGWIQAGAVREGMLLGTGHPSPNAKQAQLLCGTLLGDGSIKPLGKGAVISLTQCAAQEEWLDLKMSALQGFTWTPKNGTKFLHANSHVSQALLAWRRDWYDGKKRLPRETIRENFGPLLLATWYGDDGSLGGKRLDRKGELRPEWRRAAVLSTQGFSDSDVEWLASLLAEHGLETSTHRVRWRTGSGLTIRITAESAETFFKLIGPYMPECLRYKLPEGMPEFDPALWMLESAHPHFAKVLSAERKSYKSGRGEAKTTFHISVEETGNFIAANMVVHNTQDDGAFVELVQEGDKPESAVAALNHLDTARCFATGDLEYPALFEDLHGHRHALKWHQVVHLAEMPAPHFQYGLWDYQYCALTRILNAVKVMQSIVTYKKEKVSGQQHQAIHVLQGITTQQVNDAMAAARAKASTQGMMRWMEPLLVGSIEPDAKIDLKTLELAGLPDKFDEETMFKHYISIIAMGFRSDYQEFAPLPGGNLGTSGQSRVQHAKTQGKGPAYWQKLITHMINWHVLPSRCEFRFDEKDWQTEGEEETARGTRATRIAALINLPTPVLTPSAARQMLLDAGDITQEIFDSMGESSLELGQVIVEDESRYDPDNGQPVVPPASTPPTNGTAPVTGDQVQVKAAKPKRDPFHEERLAQEKEAQNEIQIVLSNLAKAVAARIREGAETGPLAAKEYDEPPLGWKYSEDEPRAPAGSSEGGQWTSDGGSSSPSATDRASLKGPYTQVKTATEAIKALAEGKYVQLPPEQVGVMLDRMAAQSQEAEKLGQKAPLYDLCHVSVPDTSLFCAGGLGVPRAEMPQIEHPKQFEAYLKEWGATTKDVSVRADHLKATQNQLDGAKVGGMMAKARENGLDVKRIFISSDNFVLDGHHRWAAMVGLEYDGNKPIKMDATRVNLPITVLLKLSQDYMQETGGTAKPFGAKGNPNHDERGRFAESDFSGAWHHAEPYHQYDSPLKEVHGHTHGGDYHEHTGGSDPHSHGKKGLSGLIGRLRGKDWNEELHPRNPIGSPEGGEFTSAAGGEDTHRGGGDRSGGFPPSDPRSDPAFREHYDMQRGLVEKYLVDGKATGQLFDNWLTGTMTKGPAEGKPTNIYDIYRGLAQIAVLTAMVDRAKNVPNEGKVIMMGGLPGSGKDTMIALGKVPGVNADGSNFAMPNPDTSKEAIVRNGMVPMDQYPGLGPNETVSLTHEESSYLSKIEAGVLARPSEGESQGKNVLWNITMASKESTDTKIRNLLEQGYKQEKMQRVFVRSTIDNSLQRAGARYAKDNYSGRLVSLKSISDQRTSAVNPVGPWRGEPYTSKYEQTFWQVAQPGDVIINNTGNDPRQATSHTLTAADLKP